MPKCDAANVCTYNIGVSKATKSQKPSRKVITRLSAQSVRTLKREVMRTVPILETGHQVFYVFFTRSEEGPPVLLYPGGREPRRRAHLSVAWAPERDVPPAPLGILPARPRCGRAPAAPDFAGGPGSGGRPFGP